MTYIREEIGQLLLDQNDSDEKFSLRKATAGGLSGLALITAMHRSPDVSPTTPVSVSGDAAVP